MTSGPDVHDIWHAVTVANRYMDARNYRRAEEVVRVGMVAGEHELQLAVEVDTDDVRHDSTLITCA